GEECRARRDRYDNPRAPACNRVLHARRIRAIFARVQACPRERHARGSRCRGGIVGSSWPTRLTMEVTFTVVGFEKSADGAIPVVCAECAAAAIELGKNTAGLARFENRTADGCVAKFLRESQILLGRDLAELAPVFLIVLF